MKYFSLRDNPSFKAVLNVIVPVVFFYLFFRHGYHYFFNIPQGGTVNHSDHIENILYAFYSSHGWIAYSDFASNHLPGVYLLLSLVYKTLGFNHFTPYPGLEFQLEYAGKCFSAVFQMCAFYFIFVYLKLSRVLAAVFSALLVMYFSRKLGMNFVLSENFLFPLMAASPLLLKEILCADKAGRFRASLFTAIIFCPFAIYLGLTYLPSIAVLGFISLIGIAVNFDKSMIMGLMRKHFVIPFLPFFILFIYTLSVISVEDMLFFNLDLNRGTVGPKSLSPFVFMMMSWTNALKHFAAGFNFTDSFYPVMSIVVTVLLSLLVFVQLTLRGKSLQGLFFTILTLAVTILCCWRFAFGYKASGVIGVNVGLCILFVSGLRDLKLLKVSFWDFVSRYYRFAVLCAAILAVVMTNNDMKDRASKIPDDENLVGMCKFGEAGDCACGRMTHWTPGFYLNTNVEQCKPYGIWMPNFSQNKIVCGQFSNDIDNAKVGIVLSPDLKDVSGQVVCQNYHPRLVHRLGANKTCSVAKLSRPTVYCL